MPVPRNQVKANVVKANAAGNAARAVMMHKHEAASPALSGAGLGLRRALAAPLQSVYGDQPDFLEVAPENWMRAGCRWRRDLDALAERYPLASHGLSLSIGSPDPLDVDLLDSLRAFIERYDIRYYTEHLSYCSEGGHLYDLLPMPFCEEAVYYVADRIRQVQDHLGQRIGMENISYYADFGNGMSELDFICAVAAEADCDILLDVNNVYVNSINHRAGGRSPDSTIRRCGT